VDSAIVEMYNQLAIMRNTPITDEELSNVKSGYFGSFAMSMEDPTTIANQALSIRTENLPDDFYKTFLSNLNEVAKDDVIESANKFFLIDNAQIVVTGKIRDIMDKLENISLGGKEIEVVYHDNYGKIIGKPDYSVDSSITAETVVKNYVDAIGGKEKLSKVSSIETKATFCVGSSGAFTRILFVSNGIAVPTPRTPSIALAILFAVEKSP